MFKGKLARMKVIVWGRRCWWLKVKNMMMECGLAVRIQGLIGEGIKNSEGGPLCMIVGLIYRRAMRGNFEKEIITY